MMKTNKMIIKRMKKMKKTMKKNNKMKMMKKKIKIQKLQILIRIKLKVILRLSNYYQKINSLRRKNYRFYKI